MPAALSRPRAAAPSKPRFSAPSRAAPYKAAPPNGDRGKPEPQILFQKYFKSIGPRTYAAQVKEAGNGNHFLVLTEGKRDEKTGELRKIRVFVFSEDFPEFFRMLHETAKFIRENPVPPEVKEKRERYWARQKNGNGAGRSNGR